MTQSSPPPRPDASPDTSPATEPDAEGEARSPRKERVLHTRIPAVLEEELRAAAQALRVPVSNLVRTILEDALTLADRAGGEVEDRLASAARTVHSERERLRKVVGAAGPEVVAYQAVLVAADTACSRCGQALPAGTDAALGISDRPGPRRFFCQSCLPRAGAT